MDAIRKISAFCILVMCGYGWWLIIEDILDRIFKRRHRRKVDARIIKQAKELGVWDYTPIVLGGRALELKAWEAFKIKRKPGETDAEMRCRCMAAMDAAGKEERKDE